MPLIASIFLGVLIRFSPFIPQKGKGKEEAQAKLGFGIQIMIS
jgi:hypothetical protein